MTLKQLDISVPLISRSTTRKLSASIALCTLLWCNPASPQAQQGPELTQDTGNRPVVDNRPTPVEDASSGKHADPGASAGEGTLQGAPAAISTAPELRIGSGDLLEISLYGAPEFDKFQARVSGTGDVVLPFIGAQHLAGLSVAEAQKLISRKLADGDYFHDPQVVVFVREYVTQGVSVLGEVQKPGFYPLLGARRLFDVISQAGGLTSKAGRVINIAHREHPDTPQTLTLGDEVQGSVEGNTAVFAGDTIVVSKAGIVYVVGDVRLPGGFIMENGEITVLQALALAQGANPTASLNKAKLIRTTDGKREETPIALKSVLGGKADDRKLKRGDILFVPASAGKSAARRSMDAIIQTATGVAIYGRY
jgi:polysaccharide export outer membrane protein